MSPLAARRRALRELTQGVLTCRSAPAGGVFIAVVPTVVVTIAGPVVRDAAAAGALELGVGAGPGAAHFVAAVPAVVICNHAGGSVKSSRRMPQRAGAGGRVSPESQRHCALTHRPLEQLNCVSGSQVGKAETQRSQLHVSHKLIKSCNE